MHRASRALSALLLAALAAVAAPAHAQFGGGGAYPVTVTATAVDLANTTAGQDRWRFDFTVTGPMSTGDVLGVLFGDIYSNLVSLTPSVPGQYTTAIDTSSLTPQFQFTDDGSTATTQSFSVGLVLSPTVTLPGSLSLASVYNGIGGVTAFRTIPLSLVPAAPVPEASTLSMLALGLGVLTLARRRRAARIG